MRVSQVRTTVTGMDVILVPGLWLDASSWRDITPALDAAGLHPHPLTMPGLGAPASETAGLRIGDWVDAVVAEIDRIDGPVVLVGHSGGGNVVWGAADKRPDRVARAVFVDSAPPPSGASVSEFDVVDGVIPFPGWDTFDEPDVADLDDATRAQWAARALSVPEHVPTGALTLADDARYRVPVTVLAGQVDAEGFADMLTQWGPFADEFAAIADTTVIKLDTGHWPQFSQPERLAREIVAAARA